MGPHEPVTAGNPRAQRVPECTKGDPRAGTELPALRPCEVHTPTLHGQHTDLSAELPKQLHNSAAGFSQSKQHETARREAQSLG